MPGMAIGKIAMIAATKVQTIRYYEEIGLIRPFTRSEGGHRLYGPEDVLRLKFIVTPVNSVSASKKSGNYCICQTIRTPVAQPPTSSPVRISNRSNCG